jgi:F-type H+-transporting ATPase subunit b
MNYEDIAKWSQIVSAVAFYAVIVWLWLKFIAPALKTAQANTNKRIAEAERHRDEAKAALESLRHGIEGAKNDAALIRQRADEQGRSDATNIVTEARETGERALRNAQGELERARLEARDSLRTEFAEKALSLARQEAHDRVDGNVNAQLVERFVSSLEHGAKN